MKPVDHDGGEVDVSALEQRKREEIDFHNRTRIALTDEDVRATRWTPELERTISENPMWVNMKYYAIERRSRDFVEAWHKRHCRDKKVLDLCCGNGGDSIFLAKECGATVIGIDLSDVSIENCTALALQEGVAEKVRFEVRDAERTGYAANTFDVVNEYGALHHVDLDAVYAEMARVLKPGGLAICVETLRHNPFIHLYRKLTPHLRTRWEVEHILRRRDIQRARKYFEHVDVRLYHLTTILAVPLRNTRLFGPVLSVLEAIDRLLVRLPGIRWQAWQAVILLSGPRK
jgi:ubiquinone/menaquinone biosynthesis C-methylase UbiE